MIPASFAPWINHLWQSTLFAAVAGLLTLALQRNKARVRYWLWLAASCKFLIPFSLLISLGSLLRWRVAPAPMPHAFSAVADTVLTPIFLTPLPKVTSIPSHTPVFVFVVWAVWACGFVAVVAGWTREWLRIRAIVRAASPLPLELPIQVKRTPAQIEPGVFGIFRPVLLLPKGIESRLTQAQLQGILEHELCHFRRRDNFTAALHMLVEAIFWFHPLVWWMGQQLMAEREQACDEEVLELGRERQLYAESILKVCEYCIESPLACVSGVMGADLKKRLVRIMTGGVARKLNFSKKLLLSMAGLMAIAVPIVFGQVNATQNNAKTQPENTTAKVPEFEVASIKPNKSGSDMSRLGVTPDEYSVTNVTLHDLIQLAYGVRDNQISGAPKWLNSGTYDVEAKVDKSVADELKKLSRYQRQLVEERMLQPILEDRLQLKFHRGTKELPVYSLVVAKAGKLHKAEGDCGTPSNLPMPEPHKLPITPCGYIFISQNSLGLHIDSRKVSVAQLADSLSRYTERVVLDKTGLVGKYDITLEWIPEQRQFPAPPGDTPNGLPPPPQSDHNGIPLFTAIHEQLGLKLVPQKGPVEILVIDHVERPSEN